jgi:hypothetical protein
MAILKLPRFLRSRKARLEEAEETIRQNTLDLLSRDLLAFTCVPSDIKGLDLVELERLSRELTELGFDACEDRRTRWQGDALDSGFHRIFMNAAESCFAGISGTMKGFQKGNGLSVGFDAPLKQGAGWIGAANLKVTPVRLYMRCPSCALLLMPLSDANSLFERFLGLRQSITSQIGITPPQNLTVKMLDSIRAEHLPERLAAIRMRSYFHEARDAAKFAGDHEWLWRGQYR